MLKLLKLLKPLSLLSQDEKYLSESTSLEDLERRQKSLSRGEAPFQIYNRNYLQGISHQ